MSALGDLLRRRPRWLVIVAAVYGPLGIGVGVWLFVTSIHEHTETVSARISSEYALRGAYVNFKFADGSEDSEFASPGDSLFDAVEEFGPGPARVTRNVDNGTIETVVFHDKKYTPGEQGSGLIGGIIAVVLGVLGVVYVIRPRHRIRRTGPPA